MANSIREANLNDTAQVAEVFATGFMDDDVFGRFMAPRRHEYPEAWLRHWNDDIRAQLIDPQVLTYVLTDDKGLIKAACIMKRLGKGGEARAADRKLSEGMQVEPVNERKSWTDRSADPEAVATFERNWEDKKHHFSGDREESWMIEMFCVAPDAQKRGYGRQLIHKAIEVCRAEKPMVPLCLISSEIGDAFYEKLGFREVGNASVGDMAVVRGGSIKFYESHLQT